MNVEKKIAQLEKQLAFTQSELELLKQYVKTEQTKNSLNISPAKDNSSGNSYPPVLEPQKPDLSEVQQESDWHTEKAKNLSTPEYDLYNESIPTLNLPKSASSQIDWENMLGKYFMGVAASVLIFVALILFGILVYHNFTDTLKMITIYGISTVLLCSGWFPVCDSVIWKGKSICFACSKIHVFP